MKLSLEDIKKITTGSLKIELNDDVFSFEKCSLKQKEAWSLKDENLGIKSLDTTGISLSFHTNSMNFGFTVHSGDKFDLLIDNFIHSHFVVGDNKRFDVSLKDGDKRITLVFPSHTRGMIKDVTIDDGAYLIPHNYKRKILFYGDSITQGWDSEFDSNSFAWRLSLKMDAESIIHGIGGATFYPDIIDDINFDPDMIFVALGTNDWFFKTSKSVFINDCELMLSKLYNLYSNKELYCILPIYRTDHQEYKEIGTFDEIRKIINDIANKYNFKVIDGFKLVPHLKEMYKDGLHPNDMGFGFYYENLLNEINKR